MVSKISRTALAPHITALVKSIVPVIIEKFKDHLIKKRREIRCYQKTTIPLNNVKIAWQPVQAHGTMWQGPGIIQFRKAEDAYTTGAPGPYFQF